jgi:predicted MPP superfamily phosphohydrolase
MWPVTSLSSVLVATGMLFVIAMTSWRLIQPELWRSRAVRVGTFVAFAGLLSGMAMWAIGSRLGRHDIVSTGVGITYVGLLVLGPAILVLPLATLLDRIFVGDRKRTQDEKRTQSVLRTNLSRRALIRTGTAALPAALALTGVRGLRGARETPRIPIVPMRYEGLHPDLEGYRILQLSDLHLGACAGLDDLAKALDAAMIARPDLIVLTGDLADDPSLIPGALDLVMRARARHGAIASLGNHEYLHDIAVTRPLYESSPVPLLVSSGRTLGVGRARLFIGGADDPVHMDGDVEGMLRPSIDSAARHAPRDADFRMLLCHRPEGFGPGAEAGFDLTLAGHTHGGQIGLFGRSILEKLRPGTGWWGTYARRRSTLGTQRTRLGSSPARLYTTSGFGHWFPFRLGCPTETAIIVLETAPTVGDGDGSSRV